MRKKNTPLVHFDNFTDLFPNTKGNIAEILSSSFSTQGKNLKFYYNNENGSKCTTVG